MSRVHSFQIVIAEPFDAAAVARLETIGRVRQLERCDPEALLEAVPDADALLVKNRAHITARVLDAARCLKVIGRAATSVDHIDLRAASRKGITVIYAPHAGAHSIAEFILGQIVTLLRRVPFMDRRIREGAFDQLRGTDGRELRNLTVGLLGGNSAAGILSRLCQQGFACRVIQHDPQDGDGAQRAGETVDLDRLLRDADVLSIHLALRPGTRGLLDRSRIAQLKPGAILINTSSGAVVDGAALAQALKSGRLAGAAIDAHEHEPLPLNHPIRSAPNCILTPHVAGLTENAVAERFTVADDVIRFLKGEAPRHPAPIPDTAALV